MTIKTVDYFLDSVVEEIEAKSQVSTFLNPPGSTGKTNLWVELIEIENISSEIMFSYNINFEVRIFILYTYHLKNSHHRAFEIIDSIYKALCIENLSKIISGYSILGIRNTKISIKRPEAAANSDSFRIDMHYSASVRGALNISDLQQNESLISTIQNNDDDSLLIQNQGNL
jgi:hypothetical protein